MSAQDPWIDPDTEPVRRRHLQPLAGWIDAEWGSSGPARLLDYGCGDLLLAAMLTGPFTVDGHDPNPAARRAAARRVDGGAVRGSVLDRPEDVAPRTYDGVVLSSVVQYLDGPSELTELLQHLGGALGPSARGIVVTDVVVPGSRRTADAWDLWRDLAGGLGRLAAGRELVRSARRSPGRLWAPEPAELDSACRAAGLRPRRLPANLSSFRRRATYVQEPTRIDPEAGPRGGDPAMAL